jgi:hypothetical protein
MTSVGILIDSLEALWKTWMKKLSRRIGEEAWKRSKKLKFVRYKWTWHSVWRRGAYCSTGFESLSFQSGTGPWS